MANSPSRPLRHHVLRRAEVGGGAGQGGDAGGAGEYRNNFNVDLDEFVLAVREDFHLKPGSKLIGKAVMVDAVDGIALRPTAEYQHPRTVRALKGGALSPGAMQ